jgi:hypothetical protein
LDRQRAIRFEKSSQWQSVHLKTGKEAALHMSATITKVTIMRAEGPSGLCGIVKEFPTIQAANSYLRSQDRAFAKMGYDKHDFEVFFDDPTFGYKGRLDAMHPDNKYYNWLESNDIYHQMTSYLKWILAAKDFCKPDEKQRAELTLLLEAIKESYHKQKIQS